MKIIKRGLPVFLSALMISATAWASIANQMTGTQDNNAPQVQQQTMQKPQMQQQLRETPQKPEAQPTLPQQRDASSELVYVEKGLYLISNEKQAELTKKLDELNKKYDVHVGIHIVKNLPVGAKDLESEAKRFVESGSYKDGKNGSMVLYITMSNRKYYIATGNYMNRRITSAEGIPYIKDEIVPYLKDNKFDEAAEAFVEAADKELAFYAEEGEPYNPSKEFSLLSAVLAAILAVLTGMGVRSFLISTMSNVAHETAADEYLERDTFKLTHEDDTYLYTTTTVVPKSHENDDDSSSSDDSGSTGGGGGSF